ncbi:histidinol dehydrogenase [Hymenobacter artigasi]|uniref:Multifunctional fusion protein n=1 Tax=Hymenobacter artigasi TaxID=2719616 RepID=A0ABX1HJR5_9BACT|nr:histidinol dehydrogenase [Hymenobacter artigasi]NKI89287.1 histidinol dehydrogenase [Hymenobacter artigasi]
MQLYSYPDSSLWAALQQRPAAAEAPQVAARVRAIFEQVRAGGDAALLTLAAELDKATLTSLLVSDAEFAAAAAQVPAELQAAIRQAKTNIEAFHTAQREPELRVETMPGVMCSRRAVPVQRVGLYVPGGSAPLFSTLLMLGVPARLAGCPEVVVCTPPQADGSVSPVILFVAQLLGIDKVVKAGGAQAVAALALGTASVPAVDKIFGPGNRYVTAAKQLAAAEFGVAIDMPAGPSEVLVIADASANPAFVAADLLSQAEHGPDSQVVVLSDSSAVLEQVQAEVVRQLALLPRRDVAAQALASSRAILLADATSMLEFSNQYAPEHLILATDNADALAAQVTNAGSVFLGHLTPEAVGDYASGTNHTLPTSGYARQYSGVSLDSFVKKITFQRLSAQGLQALGSVVEIMAEAEGLAAHARAVTLRLASLDANASPAGAAATKPYAGLIRPSVERMQPYSSARDEFEGMAPVMLDANENSLGSVGPDDFSRYPDPHQRAIKADLARLKGVMPNQIFLGNGSDEAIDLLVRLTCTPGQDAIVICPPTYGMYEVAANLNDVRVERLPLTADFQLPADAAEKLAASNAKLVFLCSPNNPTGNLLAQEAVETILRSFRGLVIVDEAYADFADAPSWITRLAEFPRLVVMQTFSKAWGLAGLRLGVAYASAELIAFLDKIKPPYNISAATQQHALAALAAAPRLPEMRDELLAGRSWLVAQLAEVAIAEHIFPSDANFLLVRFTVDATAVYDQLQSRGIVVRNRTTQPGCAGCLRLTVGTTAENSQLVQALTEIGAETRVSIAASASSI